MSEDAVVLTDVTAAVDVVSAVEEAVIVVVVEGTASVSDTDSWSALLSAAVDCVFEPSLATTGTEVVVTTGVGVTPLGGTILRVCGGGGGVGPFSFDKPADREVELLLLLLAVDGKNTCVVDTTGADIL